MSFVTVNAALVFESLVDADIDLGVDAVAT
jgi:hypothetical protein